MNKAFTTLETLGELEHQAHPVRKGVVNLPWDFARQ